MRANLRFLGLTLVILLVGIHSMAQSLPPGSKYLGLCINLINGDTDPRGPMLLQALNQSDIEHTPRGGGQISASSETAKSVSEASRKYTIKMGLEVKYGAFSANASMSYSDDTKEKTETELVTITKDIEIATLSIKEPLLEQKFKEDLNNPQFSPEVLFEKYGTHISLGVKVGGRFSGFFSSYGNTKETITNVEMAAKVKYATITADSASYKNESRNYDKNTLIKDRWLVKGGSPAAQANLEGSKSPENFVKWVQSTEENPGFYSFTSIKPIWELADDPNRKKYLEIVFKKMFTKKSLENPQRFTGTSEYESPAGTETLMVPAGYKILSGGAMTGKGTFLIASYPANTNSWVASWKDHTIGLVADVATALNPFITTKFTQQLFTNSPSNVTISVMAVYDPFDYLDVQILNNKSPQPADLAQGDSPGEVQNDKIHYALVGGGSKVEYEGGAGNLLTQSYPKIDKDKNLGYWSSASTFHLESSPAKITSYAIFIAFLGDLSNPIYIIETKLFPIDSGIEPANKIMMGGVETPYKFIGGGAYTSTQDGKDVHNFLIASYPGTSEWNARSRQNEGYPAILHVVAIGLKINLYTGR